MDCVCFQNNGPMMTPQPHMIPGYAGHVPQYKFRFGHPYGMQTNRLFLDPAVSMGPVTVLQDICPKDCGKGGYLQSPNTTGQRCLDPYVCPCNKPDNFYGPCNPGFDRKAPRFQTILNHSYSPTCMLCCTKTYEQDLWRDAQFIREKEAMDGWRFCYKTKPYERPERLKPWDGDHAEFRRTQTTLLPPLMKDDLDIHLRGTSCDPAAAMCSC